MKPAEFIRRLSEEMAREYVVRPPLSDEEWEVSKASASVLPGDLVDFFRLANGIDFWVSENLPEGYLRLLPLGEIDGARQAMWGDLGADMEPDWVPLPHWLAVSADRDGAAYIVLDVDRPFYYLMDTCGADLGNPIGATVEDLLEYIWRWWVKHRQA